MLNQLIINSMNNFSRGWWKVLNPTKKEINFFLFFQKAEINLIYGESRVLNLWMKCAIECCFLGLTKNFLSTPHINLKIFVQIKLFQNLLTNTELQKQFNSLKIQTRLTYIPSYLLVSWTVIKYAKTELQYTKIIIQFLKTVL